MTMFKVALLLVVVFVFQASGALTEFKENSQVKKFKEQAKNVLLHDVKAALSNLELDSSSFKETLVGAKSTLAKLKTCKTERKLELVHQAGLTFINFQACINATVDIADFETFLLHLYNLTVNVTGDVEVLVKSLASCYTAGNVFDILTCVVTALQNSGTNFDSALSRAKALIAEVEGDTDKLFSDGLKCLGFSATKFMIEASRIISKC